MHDGGMRGRPKVGDRVVHVLSDGKRREGLLLARINRRNPLAVVMTDDVFACAARGGADQWFSRFYVCHLDALIKDEGGAAASPEPAAEAAG